MEPKTLSVAAKLIQAHQLPYLDLIPVLAGERILSLLLKTLLTLREALVPVPLSDVDLEYICCPSIASHPKGVLPLAIR